MTGHNEVRQFLDENEYNYRSLIQRYFNVCQKEGCEENQDILSYMDYLSEEYRNSMESLQGTAYVETLRRIQR